MKPPSMSLPSPQATPPMPVTYQDSCPSFFRTPLMESLQGKDSVLGGGFKSKVMGLMNEVLPETTKAAQAGKQTKPGSAKH